MTWFSAINLLDDDDDSHLTPRIFKPCTIIWKMFENVFFANASNAVRCKIDKSICKI